MDPNLILMDHLKQEITNLRKTISHLKTTSSLEELASQLRELDRDIRELTHLVENTSADITPMELSETFLEQCAEESGFETVTDFLKHIGGMSTVIGRVSWDS